MCNTRSVSGELNIERSLSAYTMSPNFGLVVSGSWTGGSLALRNTTEYTLDGSSFNIGEIPHYIVDNWHHCIASVDDQTLISIGAIGSLGTAVLRFTAGNSDWEELQSTEDVRESTATYN